MDSTLLKQFNHVVNREKAKLNKRLVIFLFFLAISTVLWFLIKLSHEYTTELDYPIRLVDLPKGKVIVGSPSRTIRLRVKAYGYTLLRYKVVALMSPLQVSLKGVKPMSGNSQANYYLTTGERFPSLVSQLSEELSLIGVSPDTLFFSMTKVIDREVRVIPDLVATYKAQHMLAGTIRVKPNSVVITGPKSIVDTIAEIRTKPQSLNLLSETVTVDLPLLPIPQVTYSQPDVRVEIPVEKFTEITLEVPIIPINVPDHQQVVLLPESIRVKCNVTISKFFLLKPSQFRVVCDFANADNFYGGKVRVSIDKFPDYVSRIDYQPKYVDYIIKNQ